MEIRGALSLLGTSWTFPDRLAEHMNWSIEVFRSKSVELQSKPIRVDEG